MTGIPRPAYGCHNITGIKAADAILYFAYFHDVMRFDPRAGTSAW